MPTNGQPRVLVAEDDAAIRDVVALALEAEGYVVTTARDGAEALDAALHDPPDLLLTDQAMPRLTGLELITRLRAVAPCRQLPVLLISAAPPRIPPLPRLAVLAKPFDLDRLLRVVATLCGDRPRG